MNHKMISGLQICSILKERNDLRINKIEYAKNRHKNLLILLVESEVMIYGNEVYAFLRENMLIIEAPLLIEVEKPVRTHLIEKENLEEFEKEIAEIRFTEIKLDKKYKYNMISYSMIKPGLLKIVMHYKQVKSLRN